MERPLANSPARLQIISNKGAVVSDQEYAVSSSGNREYFELMSSSITPVSVGGSQPSLITGRTVDGSSERTLVGINSDEGNTFQQECTGYKEIFPGHNALGENRVNLVFVGLGYGRDQRGLPEFTKYLLEMIDYNAKGVTERYTREDLRKRSTSGLFGMDPFKYNNHLFNFWYLDQDLPLPSSRNDLKETCDRYNPIEPCGLSNTNIIYVLRDKCKSSANFDRWFSFVMGGNSRVWLSDDDSTVWNNIIITFLHEVGHSFGNLADEYTTNPGYPFPLYPNCLPSSKPWWPNVFNGCSYAFFLVKPTEMSVMGGGAGHLASGFGNDGNIIFSQRNYEEINEAHICYRMIETTGQVDLRGICTGNLHGRGGYTCSNDAECISGVCDYPQGIRIKQCLPSGLTKDRFCSTSRQCTSNLCASDPLGEKICLNSNFEDYQNCYVDAQCLSGSCRRIGQFTQKQCIPLKNIGDSCWYNEECPAPNLCRGPINAKFCIAGFSVGETCENHNQCLSGNCINNPAGQGKFCLAETGSLGYGASCSTDSECSSNLCRYPAGSSRLTCLPSNLQAGASCSLSIQCQSFNCLNNVCSSQAQTNLPDGSLCTVDSDCSSGACIQYQTRRVCGASSIRNGGVCLRSSQCRSGYCALTPGGWLCSACTSNSQCPNLKVCNSGRCV
ncbi:MAG TPA: hypothetical protein VFE88_00380 [Candidatus Nanoarchaeia archaeon]|nr:hypothetical protein [Candidatus Nanoarchaeia archaeon]